MHKAVIDLGTNTFNLLIADVNMGELKVLFKTKMPAKLGEGSIGQSIISDKAMQRGLDILKTYRGIIQEHQVIDIRAFATSAVRSSKNGKDFVDKIKQETGIQVNIISGIEEAELIYEGVKNAYRAESSYVILDIGGGSTEFIVVENHQVVDLQSFDLGMARLLDLFQPSDPISTKEIADIFAYLSKSLMPFLQSIRDRGIRTLVGSSGSFDTLISIMEHRFSQQVGVENKLSHHISIEHFNQIYHQIVGATLAERKTIKGMDLMRVEMMALAVVFIRFIIEELNINTLVQTQYALKEGAFFRKI